MARRSGKGRPRCARAAGPARALERRLARAPDRETGVEVEGHGDARASSRCSRGTSRPPPRTTHETVVAALVEGTRGPGPSTGLARRASARQPAGSSITPRRARGPRGLGPLVTGRVVEVDACRLTTSVHGRAHGSGSTATRRRRREQRPRFSQRSATHRSGGAVARPLAGAIRPGGSSLSATRVDHEHRPPRDCSKTCRCRAP